MKYGFIGTGNMASAMIIGATGSEAVEARHIFVYDLEMKKSNELASLYGVKACRSATELVSSVDVVILAVKPINYEDALEKVKAELAGKIVVSIGAGVTLNYVKSLTDESLTVVRVMPNLPAEVSAGMTGICFDNNIDKKMKVAITKFFYSLGEVIEIEEEKMDAVVALAGSAPAYGYLMIEAMAKAGEKLGLDYDTSLFLASNSILGAARMVCDTGLTPKELTDNVCSPGGTTAEGVAVMDRYINALMEKTTTAVFEKSKSMTK